MSREEAIKILSILRVSYPKFYQNIDKSEAKLTVELYQEMFEDCDVRLVVLAVKELINTFKYPPTIADIKSKMYELCTRNNEKNPIELWNELLSAIKNGYYGCVEEFEKLPTEVKQFLGTPNQLRELATMDSSTVHSVVKGQFLKQIESIKQQKKENFMMLQATKNLVASLENKKMNCLNTKKEK